MPKIVFKELTLNDQAFIIKYNHRDTFYLRIKREGKRYTNVSLKTEDLDVARRMLWQHIWRLPLNQQSQEQKIWI